MPRIQLGGRVNSSHATIQIAELLRYSAIASRTLRRRIVQQAIDRLRFIFANKINLIVAFPVIQMDCCHQCVIRSCVVLASCLEPLADSQVSTELAREADVW